MTYSLSTARKESCLAMIDKLGMKHPRLVILLGDKAFEDG